MSESKAYYNLSTSEESLQTTLDKVRNWRIDCTNMSPKEILKKYLELLATQEFRYAKDNQSTYNASGLEYITDLIKDIFAEIIEKNSITVIDIKVLFKDSDPSCKPIKDLEDFCKLAIDIKRMKTNHAIISKRYNLKSIINRVYLGTSRETNGYMLPLIFAICRKLDTYNLELPDKINLMCEEILYIIEYEFKYAFSKDMVLNDRIISQIFPGVMTYIMGTYSSDGVPKEITDKVLNAAYEKITNSALFKTNYGIYEYFEYIKAWISDDIPKEFTFNYLLFKAQQSGSINTKQGFIKLIFNIAETAPLTLRNVLEYIIYFYGIFTDKMDSFNISLSKLLNAFVNKSHDVLMKKDYTYDMNYLLNNDIRVINQFLFDLKPMPMFTETEDHDFINRYSKVITELVKLLDVLHTELQHNTNVDISKKNEEVDVHDDTGLPLTLSTYEKKILATSEFMVDRLNESVESRDAFIDIATDKTIISNKYTTDFLSKALDECSFLFDLDRLKSSLKSAYNTISEDYHSESTDPRHYIVLGEISNLIAKINKINENAKVIDESFDMYDYPMNDIDETIKSAINTNIACYIVSETVHDISKIPVHEMKISSYANLVMDKFRQGYDYLNDKQKAAFDTLDRLAERFSHFDDKEARAEARMQVVKGQMLPSLSRCIKTLLFAGLIAIINPWLGLLAIVIKYVTSKNATKEERQAVCDELEVEIQMIDRKIQDAVDDKNYKLERKLRLLKKKMLVQYSKISYDNMVKWDNSLYMKNDTDETGQKIGLKEE